MPTYKQPLNEPIAIIGSGCRFPGNASSPSRLWDLLVSPKDVSKRVPETRFNPDGFYHPNGEHHGASNVTKSYFLEEDPRHFDSIFFNTTPKEAEAIDPQHRLLLETVYEAMESSGLTIKQLQASQTSAYVGIMTADYTDTHVSALLFQAK
jgi:acyl transferase domain-containing protein